MHRRAFLRLTLTALAAAPFVRTFGADVVSPQTSALPRIVSMSNPVGPDWPKQWFRNVEYVRGRQWLVFDEVALVEVPTGWSDDDYIVQAANMPEDLR